MADNITLNSGSGGAVLKTDDDGTAHWQEVKVAFGADGTQTRVTASAPLPVTEYPVTTGGLSVFKGLDVDESEDEVKGSAGQVYGIHAMNLANAKRYLKFYNDTAANVSVGTTTPVMTIPLPTQGDTNGAGFTWTIPQGIAFSAAICVACTTGIADNDTGAPGANECVVTILYK